VTVLGGDDEIGEAGRIGKLRVGSDGELLLVVLKHAERRVGIGGCDRVLQLIDGDAARRQRHWVDLDAHRVFLAAEDRHLRNAVYGRKRRRDDVLREGVEIGQRDGIADQ
jgi:hypothetical protein